MNWHVLFLTLAHRCEKGHWPDWVLLEFRYACRTCMFIKEFR